MDGIWGHTEEKVKQQTWVHAWTCCLSSRRWPVGNWIWTSEVERERERVIKSIGVDKIPLPQQVCCVKIKESWEENSPTFKRFVNLGGKKKSTVNVRRLGWEGKEEMGQKSMVVIISVIIFVTVALSKDLNINIDGNERRTKSVYEEQSQRSQNWDFR